MFTIYAHDRCLLLPALMHTHVVENNDASGTPPVRGLVICKQFDVSTFTFGSSCVCFLNHAYTTPSIHSYTYVCFPYKAGELHGYIHRSIWLSHRCHAHSPLSYIQSVGWFSLNIVLACTVNVCLICY